MKKSWLLYFKCITGGRKVLGQLKADLGKQARLEVRQSAKEQWKELLEQRRKKGKEDYLQKIANAFGMRGVTTIKA